MSNKDNGGPALPCKPSKKRLSHSNGETGKEYWYIEQGDEPGMTLRDYFAAKAMASILGNTDLLRAIPSGPDQDDAIAKAAYEMADAMLKARKS